MELWIRSQDREKIIKVNLITITKGDNITWYLENGDYILGTYATKERALEVLDEINNVKCWKYLAELNYKAFKHSLENDYSEKKQQEIFEMMNTYEMPEE